MAYIYIHTRLDKNEVFYVGIGSDKYFSRANDRNNRNKFWKNIVSKTDYSIEIVKDNVTIEEASLIEMELILKYGRKINNTGTLCNISSGGECGANGVKRSDEFKNNLKIKNLGKRKSAETISKMKSAKGTKVFCYETKIIFNGITEAAEYYNMNKHKLYGQLIRGNKNNTSMILYSDYLKELNDIEIFLKKVL